MCRSLAEFGHDVHWVVTSDEEIDPLVDGVHIHSLPKRTTRLQRFWHASRDVCRKAMEIGGDLYHFHDPELVPFAFWIASRNRKIIYDAHEDLPKDLVDKHWIPTVVGRVFAPPIDIVERLGVLRFAAVIAAEEAIERRFRHWAPHTISVHNYPRLADFHDVSIRDNDNNPFIVHFGGVSRLRAIEPIVRAMGRLPESIVPRLIVGGRCESDELLDSLRSLPGFRHIDYRGWLSHDEIRSMLQQTSIALNLFSKAPNNQRVRSNRFFESLACGAPVITSDFPAWKEIVDEVGCGLTVDPDDDEQIANAIEFLLSNPDKASEMGKRGREAIVSKFNWENEFEKLQALYATLLDA